MDYQFQLRPFSSAYEDLSDPDNDFVNYFASIRLQNIKPVIVQYYDGVGPNGYGISLMLSRILKVKEILLSDRILADRLARNATYRAVCLMEQGHTPAHNTYHTLRTRLGVEGFWQIHVNFVTQAYELGLLTPELSSLPKNRRKGIILVGDSTFIIANCSTRGAKQENGQWLFSDPSVAFGRTHHKYRYAVGHKAHTLMSLTGIPLVSVVTSAEVPDQNVIFELLAELFKRYPEFTFAYIILDKGYDSEDIHRDIYEKHHLVPVIIRKKMVYPKQFTQSGIPMCPFGYALQKKGIDYQRKRTRYYCEKICIKNPKAQKDFFDCQLINSEAPHGMVKYTLFKDSYRKFGPALPNSIIYKHLKPYRTAIEREYGLVKENRYRMEYTNTYNGVEHVLIHVIEHDIALTQDIIFNFKKLGQSSPLLKV
ncbi:MAG: transposase [Aliifodinibius sp.]|nr:transposase [Nitrosopumilaceae archaeon]NIV14322.1 transposase [Fodinibius sp.]NIX62241.1 transposase [Nitrosopumilaceae archaeon]